MIELEQIKKTDPIKSLRGQLNTAFSEIVADQPMVGACLNPSVGLYNASGALLASVTASNVMNGLNAVVLPEKNGCFVLGFTGLIQFDRSGMATDANTVNKIVVDIPAIKAANASAPYTSFLTPDHLGLNASNDEGNYSVYVNALYQQYAKGIVASLPPYVTSVVTSKNTPGTLNIELEFTYSGPSFSDGTFAVLTF